MSGDLRGTAPWENEECLVAQAARKETPFHQYMDAPTVAWIESRRHELPDAADVSGYEPPSGLRHIFDAAPVPVSWHAEPRVARSIHGTRHLLRTAVIAAALAHYEGLTPDETETLLVAAAVHDCRRVHDKDDPGHGLRGAAWLTDHAKEVFEFLDLGYSLGRALKASVAIRLHELPYADFTENDYADHGFAPRISDLLKTADALDRYRLPKAKWWPNDEYLRVLPPPGLKRLAFELVVESESAHLSGVDSTVAVWAAAASLGLA